MADMNGTSLLRAIQMYDFYLTELNLYLDTHPKCTAALKKFNEINSKRKEAYETYVKKYGPLKAADNVNEVYFTWVNDPWPWEGEMN